MTIHNIYVEAHQVRADVPDIVSRYPANPIMKASDIPGAASVCNSAVARFKDKYMAIIRADMRTGVVHHYVAESEDGIHFRLKGGPIQLPHSNEEYFFRYQQSWYDPRITAFEDGTYYITYAIENEYGVQTGLDATKDFKNFEKIAIITEPNNRNVVIFPEKIDGLFWRLDRPSPGGTDSPSGIWCASSPDLIHWGNFHSILPPRKYYWDSWKCGAGAPPIKTEEGWLIIYHGTRKTCNGLVYRVGVALLDLNNPTRVIRRAKNFLFGPTEMYECQGIVPNVCFPTAAIPNPDGIVNIYYGAADTSLCLAQAKLCDLVEFAKKY